MEELMKVEYDLFFNMIENGNFDWDMFEEGSYHFLEVLSIEEKQQGGDGYIAVENVFKIRDRFFKVSYT